MHLNYNWLFLIRQAIESYRCVVPSYFPRYFSTVALMFLAFDFFSL